MNCQLEISFSIFKMFSFHLINFKLKLNFSKFRWLGLNFQKISKYKMTTIKTNFQGEIFVYFFVKKKIIFYLSTSIQSLKNIIKIDRLLKIWLTIIL